MSAPSAVEALVFDLDGTIADTESVEYDAIRRVWADHGIDYPIERWTQVVGQAWSPSWVTELAAEAGADPVASGAAKRAYHDELLTALVLRHSGFQVDVVGSRRELDDGLKAGVSLVVIRTAGGVNPAEALGGFSLDPDRRYAVVVLVAVAGLVLE